MKYKVHPYCEFLPKMTDAEFSDLAASMKSGGGNEVPAIAWGNEILDGRSRYEASEQEGTKFYKVKFPQDHRQ